VNERVLRLLDFETIRNRVADRCVGQDGAALVRASSPQSEESAVADLKGRVGEILRLMSSGIPMPQLSLPAISFLLPRLHIEGASLDLDELYAIGMFVDSGQRLASWLSVDEAGIILHDAAASLPDCGAVSREIFKIIDRDGSLRDLPELRSIKRKIRDLRRDLESMTSRYFSDDETRRMLQSEVPAMRDGRVVLALKVNFRGRVRGIVHEVSSTGQTVFVEPEDMVEKNNDIVVEERRYAQEQARILRELSSRVAVHAEILEIFVSVVNELDALRARALYGRETRGVMADSSDSRLSLRQARHPLLGSSAVPIDFSVDGKTRVVVITGPNTGGKTVALKTVGLFALMNQFGLPVPAQEGTCLPIFDGVFADIGDEQSISQSLSTFSAHMVNMASIIGEATERSLVLLDELGSGTDPEEGSAIAMALLDHFIGIGCRALLTTHHGILKNYGYSREGVTNASVDFDKRTLSPTYRILMGIPGESRALEIAARNGLPDLIVDAARGYLDEERADVSELIRGLKSKHRELEDAEAERRQKDREMLEQRRKIDLRELRLRQRELELREQGVGSLRRTLSESRKTLENLVRELREGELTRDKTLKVKEFIADLERVSACEDERLDAESESLALEERSLKERYASQDGDDGTISVAKGRGEGSRRKKSVAQPESIPVKIEPGVQVLVGPSRLRGTVVRQAKKGYWTVETGALRATVRERDMVLTQPTPAPKAEIATADLSGTARASLELNLRGLRLDEALDALRSQLDAAAMSGLYEFSIIHGKGNGVLQKGVQDFLASQRSVAEFHYARPEDGGFGKTVVSLKR